MYFGRFFFFDNFQKNSSEISVFRLEREYLDILKFFFLLSVTSCLLQTQNQVQKQFISNAIFFCDAGYHLIIFDIRVWIWFCDAYWLPSKAKKAMKSRLMLVMKNEIHDATGKRQMPIRTSAVGGKSQNGLSFTCEIKFSIVVCSFTFCPAHSKMKNRINPHEPSLFSRNRLSENYDTCWKTREWHLQLTWAFSEVSFICETNFSTMG